MGCVKLYNCIRSYVAVCSEIASCDKALTTSYGSTGSQISHAYEVEALIEKLITDKALSYEDGNSTDWVT